MIVVSLENFMNHQNVDSRRMDLHRRIALVLRKEPGLVRDFADRLRSKLATARSPAVVSDNEREWYIILTLWSPLQVIRLLEDSSEQVNKPSGFERILHLSLCCRRPSNVGQRQIPSSQHCGNLDCGQWLHKAQSQKNSDPGKGQAEPQLID